MTTTDYELLCAFVDSRCETAFNQLVARYVNLVYSAAARMVVDPHFAEDVTQRVFVALAESAPAVMRKVASGAPLSAWLHVTTRNVAAKTVRTEERRRAREKEAASMHQIDLVESGNLWAQIAPQLDEALASVREQDRHLLLLRYFERKSIKDMAAAFGTGEDAMQKRLSRALESLRTVLARRGVTVQATVLAGLLTANALQAAPVSLLSGIAAAAFTSGTASTTGILTSIKTIGMFNMTKTQLAVTLGLIAGLGVPIAIQQAALTEISAANQATMPQSARAPGSSSRNETSRGPSENNEIERLKKLADQIRAQLAAKKSEPLNPSDRPPAVPAPVLLSIGKAVSLFDLSNAGTATPEAALQSLLAFVRERDLHGIMAVTAFPPRQADKINEALASEETRRTLSEQMQKGLFGVVISESVQKHEDGSTSEPVVKEVWPENASGQVSIEILKTEQIDERRVRISAKVLRGAESKVENYTFGKANSGWRHLWQ